MLLLQFVDEHTFIHSFIFFSMSLDSTQLIDKIHKNDRAKNFFFWNKTM